MAAVAHLPKRTSAGRRPARLRRKRANAEPRQRERIAWHEESHPTMNRASGTDNGTDTWTLRDLKQNTREQNSGCRPRPYRVFGRGLEDADETVDTGASNVLSNV